MGVIYVVTGRDGDRSQPAVGIHRLADEGGECQQVAVLNSDEPDLLWVSVPSRPSRKDCGSGGRL